MKIVEFYRGERPNSGGAYLHEIMTWKDGALEMDHDWVQWVFPSNEPSMINGDAPTLTREEAFIFINDPNLQKKIKESFIRYLAFLGMKLEDDQVHLIELEGVANSQRWTIAFNHNMLRVTRVLKCLRLTGHDQYAISLHNALMSVRERFSENTLGHWRRAVNEPLWEIHVANGCKRGDAC